MAELNSAWSTMVDGLDFEDVGRSSYRDVASKLAAKGNLTLTAGDGAKGAVPLPTEGAKDAVDPLEDALVKSAGVAMTSWRKRPRLADNRDGVEVQSFSTKDSREEHHSSGGWAGREGQEKKEEGEAPERQVPKKTKKGITPPTYPDRPLSTRRGVPFTAEEDQALISGLRMFGWGHWAMIHQVGQFNRRRTPVSLKDRARTLKLVKTDYLSSSE